MTASEQPALTWPRKVAELEASAGSRDVANCGPTQAIIHRSPDCRQGKHQACTGDAWCDQVDDRVYCTCACHAEGSR